MLCLRKQFFLQLFQALEFLVRHPSGLRSDDFGHDLFNGNVSLNGGLRGRFIYLVRQIQRHRFHIGSVPLPPRCVNECEAK